MPQFRPKLPNLGSRPFERPPEKLPQSDAPAEIPAPAKHAYSTAEQMAKSQRNISVSEFFAKNRHLLGFDNPRKALLTTVKEAVDNALDACEEAGILPEIWVHIQRVGQDRYKVGVQDNGPGILKKQIPLIFGKLLYGSKFHRMRMSRGQQGIGISAAGMHGLLTTGKPVKIMSKVFNFDHREVAANPVHLMYVLEQQIELFASTPAAGSYRRGDTASPGDPASDAAAPRG